MRLIVTSKRDVAGSNVYAFLSRQSGFERCGEFEGSPVYRRGNVLLIATERSQVEAEHLDESFDTERYVFASRHRSSSGEKTLTVHAPGNLTYEARVGGEPRSLGIAEPSAMKTALLELWKAREELGLAYKVSMEVTHHGPTQLSRPALFVEVGSTEVEWRDERAVRAVATAALAAAESAGRFESGVGVGGGHYAPRHTRFMLESKAALGHLIPSYALSSLDAEMLRQAVEKSGASFLFLDWKGMGREERRRVMALAEELGVPVRKRISAPKPAPPPGYGRYQVHSELFTLASKMGAERLREVIVEAGGFPFEKDGRLQPVFAAPSDIRGKVLRTCLEILASKKPRLAGGKLVLEERRFDPGKAEELGLKPGPEFAMLSKGLAIEAKGRRITFEDVSTRKVRVIELDRETLSLLSQG